MHDDNILGHKEHRDALHLGKFAGAHVGCPRATYGGKKHA
jgi:hypothetical protein